MTKPRPMIAFFADAAERKFAANDHKQDWREHGIYRLLTDLKHEYRELWDAVDALCAAEDGVAEADERHDLRALRQAVLAEAADVMLYAAFVADVCHALPETSDRGRRLVACMALWDTSEVG